MLIDLKCLSCGKEKKDVLIDCVVTSDSAGIDLAQFNVVCDKCKKTVFKKLLAIPGKMPIQWAQWNTKK